MSANDIPCRVSAETRQHLEEQAQKEQFGKRVFDVMDEDLFHDIISGKCAPVVQELLIKLEQIEKTNESFGADKTKAYDFLLPTLCRLRDACIEEMDRL